jgi:LemA protein
MTKGAKTFLIIAGIVILVILFVSSCVSISNNMVKMQEEIKNTWAEIDNQLKRRYDLIPNLVNTVKGYAKHEKEIFIAIADARARMAGARSAGEKVKAANQIESVLSRLLVIVEQYPNLKADTQFRALMDELAGTENRLAVSRKRYNDTVTEYNKYIRVFPNSLIAGMNKYAPAERYQIPEASKATPDVNFNN